MENKGNIWKFIGTVASYLLVAVLASVLTLFIGQNRPVVHLPGMQQTEASASKLTELEGLIDQYFIGDSDQTLMYDGAAEGMIAALADRWSYYISAADYTAHQEQMQNAYVGIGITITEEEQGLKVLQVEPGSGAQAAGILPGDYVVAVEDQRVREIGMSAATQLVRGEEDTQVSVTILRDGAEQTLAVTRQLIQVEVAKGQMLENSIGLITINNFDARCAEETIKAVEGLMDQGAKALIFDVRFNPGGYKDELVQVLDYLLPEGALFRSESYTGAESVDESDPLHIKLPMAVLVNGSSYSAAEFFAAALREYDWGIVVGQPTVGKGYFQNTFRLSDGSAVNLSIGKYYTPKGVSLAEEGGLVPDITVEVDEDTLAKIYSDLLTPEEDPQIQAAVKALTEKMQ